MAEPYPRPAPGGRSHLYRLLRDTMYATAGTIMCLTEDQVHDEMYERVRVESDGAEKIEELHGRVSPLVETVKTHAGILERLEAALAETRAKMSEMAETIKGMNTPATPPPNAPLEQRAPDTPSEPQWPHSPPQ